MIEQFISNFSGGEVSEEIYGRVESELYRNVAKRCENFIAMTQGAAVFRGGTTFIHPTRQQKVARIERFRYSAAEVYVLEFTDGKLRIYEDNALTLNPTSKTITGASRAEPCVIASVGHGFVTGDELYISGVTGMTELNGRFFRVAYAGIDDFAIVDLFGESIDSRLYGLYTAGGTATKVYELTSPYAEVDLDRFQFDQEGNDMTFTCEDYAPYRLSRYSATSWGFSTFARTADPFLLTLKNITGATKANPGVITCVGHGFSDGQRILISGVVGMTELNGNSYLVTYIGPNTFSLKTLAGVAVNTSAYTAYGSGGTAVLENYPRAVCYFEGCAYYGGLKYNTNRWVRSRGPEDTGAARYDDFTTGAEADHGIIANLTASQGEIASIYWIEGLADFMAFGTEGGVVGLDGGGDAAITPTNFRVRPIDPVGVQAVAPTTDGQTIFYVQKGGRALRSFEYDLLADRYKSFDRSFVATHLSKSGLTKIALQRWKVGLLWGVRTDGELVCLTIKPKEDQTGWHRHTIGGTNARVVDICVVPQENDFDALYVVVDRIINGTTTRYFEYLNNPWEGLDRTDYYTGDYEADEAAYLDETYEAQRVAAYLDSSLVWDGSDRGIITLTPGAISGEGVTFTASGSVFAATDVGKVLTKRYADRAGGGQARIMAFVSATVVTCDIEVDFDSNVVIPAGDWFMSSTMILGLWHLEGETVQVLADGRIYPDVVVTNGAIELVRQVSYARIGKKYRGIIIPLNLVLVGQVQNSISFAKNISETALTVANTIGVKCGTSLYSLQEIYASEEGQLTDRPPVPVTGSIVLPIEDRWSSDKELIYVQDDPYPCTLNIMNVTIDVGEK
jgi:hypothetical protein